VLPLPHHPETPAALLDRFTGRVEALARALVEAVSRQRAGASAQDAARAARDVSDDNTDRKGDAFFQICRSREDVEALLAELQHARGRGRMSDVFRQPDGEQGVTFDRFFTLVDARVELKLA
jgi:hypothetical protein